MVLVALVFEMSWILVQAARGVDSHFNERTAFEALMFSLMGIGAALLNLAVLWLGLVASWLAGQSVVPRDRLMAIALALGFGDGAAVALDGRGPGRCRAVSVGFPSPPHGAAVGLAPGSGRDPQALGGVMEVMQESAQASTRSTSSNNSSRERPVTNSSS